MTTELVSIAIGGYEDCHPFNQPTLQDVFEQVCVEAEKVWQTDGLAKALLRAAPFRKMGV